jgi:serine protease AprX
MKAWIFLCFGALTSAGSGATAWAGVEVSFEGAAYHLALNGGAAFHDSASRISGQRAVAVPDSPTVLVLWNESTPAGDVPFYAISLDGHNVDCVRQANYEIMLRAAQFDPGQVVPAVAADLGSGGNVFIVQFVTQALPEFSAQIERLGGCVYQFIPNYAYIVYMDAGTHGAVAALPYVRWVGSYEPSYRIEEVLRDNRANLEELFPWQRYNIMVFEAGLNQKHAVAERIKGIGGLVNMVDAGKFLLQATLTPAQLWQVITWDEVHFVDRWGPYGRDMDKAREYGGADYLESVAGYDGSGVRGEVFDAGFNTAHGDFASRPLIAHGSCGSDCHGASTSGIVFGDGTGDPTARGLLPAGQGIIGDYNTIGLTGPSRYQHTGEETQDPYYCVFETSSVGSPQVTNYTSDSADTDAALFDFDILHCQSQSNTGSTLSRPQAWAKNILSGGAAYHYDSLSPADDCWCGGASIGPGADGRIKPDLCGYYDAIHTTTCGGTTAYTDSFGGTSGATPIIAGHCGLFFQMWADGIFGNEVDPNGTVFDNRPHMTTAKAVMINNANQYPFSGTTADLTRVHQGWGWPNVQNVYDRRERMYIVNEDVVLTELDSIAYTLAVEPGQPEFKATMVYADPPGSPSSSVARINDLSLRVTAPDGTIYWGNNGLLTGNYSTPGGNPNTVDTVENVFIENPADGIWTVEVIAEEINGDGHVETPEMDADFALVVSGVLPCSSAGNVRLNRTVYACQSTAELRVLDCDLNTDPLVPETVTVTLASDLEPAGEPVVLTETGPATAAFIGSIALSDVDAPGVLWVADGNVLTATYIDADDGQGHYDVLVTDEAAVDCLAPEIFDIAASEVMPHSANVSFEANELVSGTVFYGYSPTALNQQASNPALVFTPVVALSGLQDNRTYYYAVQATDAAGNSVYDDNSGACYTFTTPEVPDPFTELFETASDLQNVSLTFEPNGSTDFYFGCIGPITALPSDTSEGDKLSLGDDNYVQVGPLSAGNRVWLYGTSYDRFYVGSNGYITFNGGDSTASASLSAHFSRPRVAALFDNLNPPSNHVTWQEFGDRVAVTWLDVPESGTSNQNTFQIELFFDGRIRMSYLDIAATGALAGLSRGLGIPADYYESDLSTMGPCFPIQISLPEGAPTLFSPGEAELIPVRIEDGRQFYVSGSGVLNYRAQSGAFQSIPLAHVDGEMFEVTVPAFSCGDLPEFYFSASGDGGANVMLPAAGPDGPFQGGVGTVTVLLDDNFEADHGWTVINDPSLLTGAWERAMPRAGLVTPAPGADFDGSGKCFVTGSRPDVDVDGGPTVLLSPIFDVAGGGALFLEYARWMRCNDAGSPGEDFLDVALSSDGGAAWAPVEHVANIPGWVYRELRVNDYIPLTGQVQLRFSVTDNPNDSLTEASVDAVRLYDISCHSAPPLGDLNCDGMVNGYDIDPFVLALTDPAGYAAAHPDCDYMLADCNGDGAVNGYDIDPFVVLLTQR